MPGSYRYDDYRNPYAPSIAQLLLEPGQIEAQRATTVGAANARAAEIAGAAKAGAIAGIGQTVASTIAAASDPQRQLAGAQLDQVQRDRRSRNVLEAELKNKANYNPDGSVNDQAITERLKAQDVGAWQSWATISAANQKNALDLKAKAAEIAKNNAETAEKTRQFQQGQRDYLGRLAYNTLDTLHQKPDDPLHARDTMLAATARAIVDGGISEAEGRDLLMQTAHATPQQLSALFQSVVPPELKAKLDKERADTAVAEANAKKAAAETKNLETFGQATPPQAQHVQFRLDGKDVMGSFVPDRTGGKYFYNGQDVTGRAQHVPAASIAINNTKQADAKVNRAELVDSLVKGNLVPSMLSKRADDYNATLADASRRYKELTGKDLSLSKLELDYQAAKRFVGTMNGNQMTRYRGLADSVVNTIGEVQRLGDLLEQSGVQKWNSVKRGTIRQIYGNSPESELANQYVGAVNTLKEEFANLANGGYAPTDAAWKLANDQVNGDFGFKDLRASLTEVQRLINYRTQAFNELRPITTGGPSGPQANDPLGLFGPKQ